MRIFLSYALPLSLIAAVCVLAWTRVPERAEAWAGWPVNGELVLISLYLAWMVFETATSRRDAAPRADFSDRGTRELYAAGQALTVLSALWIGPATRGPGACQAAGFLLFLAGLFLRVRAVRALGRHYSHVVRTVPDHRVIDSGPYRYIRHPAYAGMILLHAGIALFNVNFVTPVILLLVLLPSIMARIVIEEKAMGSVQGYEEFCRTRKRLIPGIW